jgi:large subunit ribosomal protein L21
MNFAVIKTGGKQYKVAANDLVKIEKLDAEPGDVVTFAEVLVVGNGDDVTVGTPLVAGATVAGHFVGTKKSRTIIIRKKERRQHFDRRNGHRQRLSTVRIGEILLGGAKTTLTVDEKLKARAASMAPATEAVVEAPAKPKAAPKARAVKPAAEAAPETKAATPKAKPLKAETPAAEPKAKKEAAPKAAKTTKPKAEAADGEKKPAARKKAAPKADKE